MTAGPANPAEARALAHALTGTSPGPQLWASAATACVAPEGHALLQALLAVATERPERREAIAATMTTLEGWMETHPEVAAPLMAWLYAEAQATYLHEICDAIELWLDACRAPEAAEQLTRLATTWAEHPLHARVTRWATEVAAQAAPAP